MPFSLKNIIFSFFGSYEARTDTFKDVNGKGIQQRFQEEIIGEEYDSELQPYVDGVFDDTLSPSQMLAKFIAYRLREDKSGFALLGSESLQRKVVEFHKAIVARKGTRAGLEMLFNLFGLTDYTITERSTGYTLDDPNRVFDQDDSTLDSSCGCAKLDLQVQFTGLTASQIEQAVRAIPSILLYMLPVTIEQGIVAFYDIEIQVQAGGTQSLVFSAIGDAVIDWGDNTVETVDLSAGTISHTYAGASLYAIRVTLLDKPNFTSITYTSGGIFGLRVGEDLLNNGPAFTLDLRNNLYNESRLNALLAELLQVSDGLSANSILIDLRNNLTTNISGYTQGLLDDLLNNHDITVLVSVSPPLLSTAPEGVGGIRLNWTDASVDIDSYEIYRKTALTAYTLIDTVGSGVSTYLDTELEDSKEYTYYIKNINVVGQSTQSNEDSATTRAFDLELQFTADSMTVDFTSSSAQNVQWRIVEPTYLLNTHVTGSSLVISELGGATVRFYYTTIADITGIEIDDNAQLRGNVDLDASYTGLLSYIGRNGDYNLLPDTWVRQASVSIDVTNSAFTGSSIVGLIDRLIIANGGTVSDDGTNFTGTAGETHAGRNLIVGTIELDLSDPANSVLFQKITALEAVGWTITTVLTLCLKRLIVNTLGATFIASEIEKTRSLEGLEYISGSTLNIELYDTEANAEIGGPTGLLASGYTAVDAWLRDDTNYNAWVYGTKKGVRFEAFDGVSTNNQSNFEYKAFPSAERACGDNALVTDPLDGNAKVYDGTFDYDIVQSVDFLDFDTPFGFCCAIDLERVNVIQNIFQFGSNITSVSQGFIRLAQLTGRTIQIIITSSGSLSRIVYQSSQPLTVGKNIISFSYDGSATASGFRVYINGVLDVPTTSSTIGTITTVKPYQGGDVICIGANPTSSGIISPVQGYIKRFEFINVEPSDADLQAACNATTGGSFRVAGYSGGDFFLEMDFDKVDGEAPVDLAGGRTVNSFGGTEYVDYPSL